MEKPFKVAPKHWMGKGFYRPLKNPLNNHLEMEMNNKGTWKLDDTAGKIYLNHMNLADRVTSYSIIDDKTIQM